MESYCFDPASREDCQMVLSSLEERLGPVNAAEIIRTEKSESKKQLSAIRHKNFSLKLNNAFKTIKKPLIIAGSVIGIVGALSGSARSIKEIVDDNDFSSGGMTISDDYGLWGEAKFEYVARLNNRFYNYPGSWTISYENICLIDFNHNGRVDKIVIEGEETYKYSLDESNKDLFLEADKKFAEYCNMLNCNQRFEEWKITYRQDLSRPAHLNYVLKQLNQ